MTKNLISILLVTCLSEFGFAQEQIDTVEVTFSKTTSMVFQFPIVSVDRGSSDVIAQKVKGVENVLQLKAARRSFPETNVSIITSDGNLHHFYIAYSDKPLTQIYRLCSNAVTQFTGKKNDMELQIASDWILRDQLTGSIVKDRKLKLKLALKEIYIHDDIIFYKVQFSNRSNIGYDIQSLRFFIRDKKKLERTSAQEIELHPVYIRNDTRLIDGNSTRDIVYALPKFTIPNAKILAIELFEKNGGRNLRIDIDNQAIVRANRLPLINNN
jgi:conjugative transposon TraN protein